MVNARSVEVPLLSTCATIWSSFAGEKVVLSCGNDHFRNTFHEVFPFSIWALALAKVVEKNALFLLSQLSNSFMVFSSLLQLIVRRVVNSANTIYIKVLFFIYCSFLSRLAMLTLSSIMLQRSAISTLSCSIVSLKRKVTLLSLSVSWSTVTQ